MQRHNKSGGTSETEAVYSVAVRVEKKYKK